jgi:hypothetical protein
MLSIAQAGRAIPASREPVMNTFPVLLAALCIYALAYRFYSAFIAAKALSIDDRRTTPAHAYPDGHNYVASPRWVLFGHHFAAIAGAGPLVGPTLAAQFGFAPGFLWILIGAVLAGFDWQRDRGPLGSAEWSRDGAHIHTASDYLADGNLWPGGFGPSGVAGSRASRLSLDLC